MKAKTRYLVSVRIPSKLVKVAGMNYIGKVTRYPDALVLRLKKQYGAEIEIIVTPIRERGNK